MKKLLILLLMTFAINMFSQELSNHALVIGNNNTNDAKAISDLFEKLDYETKLLTNIEFNKISSVTSYINMLPKESLFVFYYSGSIANENGVDYLVPINYDRNDIDKIGLSVRELTKKLLRSKTSQIIIILDQVDEDVKSRKIDLQARSSVDKSIVFIHSANSYSNNISYESNSFASSFIKYAESPYKDIFEIIKSVKRDLMFDNIGNDLKGFNNPIYINTTVEKTIESNKYGTLYVKAFEICDISYDDNVVISMRKGDEVSLPLLQGLYDLNINGENKSETIKVEIKDSITTEVVYGNPEVFIPEQEISLGGAIKEEAIEEIVLDTYNSEVENNFPEEPSVELVEDTSQLQEVDNEVTSTKTTFEDDQKKIADDFKPKKGVTGSRIAGGAIMAAISAVSFVTPVFVDSNELGGDITMWSTGGVFSILSVIEIIRGIRGE